ncbi:MAG: HepT-like ribonuclease domain-containing protein [Bacteroidota bacterium]|nr:HepT-like ribonuclease domain-containing protein [Bacteroidota bacterium]
MERELEIIGEAANRILMLNKEFPIAEARKIVDLRNWVIHGYDKVDDVIIWGILTNHLPKLKKQVEKFIQKI